MNTRSVVSAFDEKLAFSRNLGYLTESEQTLIGQIRIGIAGLGGVGGQYAEIFARIGFKNFIIADHDIFETQNTNRQNACCVSNYGKSKSSVIEKLILDINPTARVETWPEGISADRVSEFCEKIDIYIDSLDFFEIEIRRQIFKKMDVLKKPALTCAPLGFGSSLLFFDDSTMKFEDYFCFEKARDDFEKSIYFAIGLSPRLFHLKYMADPSRVNLHLRKVSSSAVGVFSCANLVAATVLKHFLKRGPIYKAPWVYQIDHYFCRAKRSFVFCGNRNPLQKLKIWLAIQKLKKQEPT